MRKYHDKEDYFDNWSPNMAYILGFAISDSDVTANSVSFDLACKDIEILRFIRAEISPKRPIPKYTKHYKDREPTHYNRLLISSQRIAAAIMKHGILPNKTGEETLPDAPPEFVHHLLRGVFDGDGGVRIRNRTRKSGPYKEYEVKFTSASESFLHKIREACGNVGGKVRLERDKRPTNNGQPRDPLYRYEFARKDGARFRDLIYPTGKEFGLTRKKVLLDQFYV